MLCIYQIGDVATILGLGVLLACVVRLELRAAARLITRLREWILMKCML